MMDYCAKESTLNPSDCEPIDTDKYPTIKTDVKETYKILSEMKSELDDFAQIVNGQKSESKQPMDASCLWEEARMMTSLAYEILAELKEVKGSVI